MPCLFEEEEVMGYLDGEMSLEAMRHFWQPLPQATRKQLIQEYQFEHALGERLMADIQCPEALWNTIQGALRQPKPKIELLKGTC